MTPHMGFLSTLSKLVEVGDDQNLLHGTGNLDGIIACLANTLLENLCKLAWQ